MKHNSSKYTFADSGAVVPTFATRSVSVAALVSFLVPTLTTRGHICRSARVVFSISLCVKSTHIVSFSFNSYHQECHYQFLTMQFVTWRAILTFNYATQPIFTSNLPFQTSHIRTFALTLHYKYTSAIWLSQFILYRATSSSQTM